MILTNGKPRKNNTGVNAKKKKPLVGANIVFASRQQNMANHATTVLIMPIKDKP